MKIILAGYNVDSHLITQCAKLNEMEAIELTPETISAAYARISRNPKPVNELRQEARQEVKKARKSNETIIFEMGHHSVAEHAVFNLDLINVSRLAIEAIENFRLCSFTEKSQRYITLDGDYVVPQEIADNNTLTSSFCEMIEKQNDGYHQLNEKLCAHFLEEQTNKSEKIKNRKKIAQTGANEDARYVLALATMGQLGMTANARNLEHIVRRCAANNNSEVRNLGEKLAEVVHAVAPSLLIFTRATEYDTAVYRELEEKVKEFKIMQRTPPPSPPFNDVQLISHSQNPDQTLLAAILYRISLLDYQTCFTAIEKLDEHEKLALIDTAFNHVELYDAVLREFEFVTTDWDLIVSASCFAQLKRHRMATISCQKYNPDLGVTIPPSISAAQAEKDFVTIIEQTQDLYEKIFSENPIAAPYILTNAHRRRVHFACNARELYHFIRLRDDAHAQWDIRTIAGKMKTLAESVMPLTTRFLSGKDTYPEIYLKHFGKAPRVINPKLPGSKKVQENL